MRTSAGTRAVGSLAPVGLLALLLTGCGTDDPRTGCTWMEDQDPAPPRG
ncbi:hypothetical protein ACFWWM_29530 [Streptomyces sp. NPDC058682]